MSQFAGLRKPAVIILFVIAITALSITVSIALAQTPASLPAVFTAAQASRGRNVYVSECAACHGGRLNDGNAVALVGPAFLQKWSHPQVTLDDLFYIVQTTMPKNRGRALPDSDYEAVLAYMLEQNMYPSSSESRLANQEQRRGVHLVANATGTVAPEFIAGPGGLAPSGTGPDQVALSAAAANASSWLYHTQNYTGTRSSPAAQITSQNANRLHVACAFQMGEATDFQTGPIVYDGVMCGRRARATSSRGTAASRSRTVASSAARQTVT